MQIYNCSCFIRKPLHSEQIVSASSLQGCNCTYKNIIHTQDFQYKECNDSYTYECLHFKYKARLFSSDNYAIILDMVYCVMDTRAYWLHSSLWGSFIEPLSYIVSVSLNSCLHLFSLRFGQFKLYYFTLCDSAFLKSSWFITTYSVSQFSQ